MVHLHVLACLHNEQVNTIYASIRFPLRSVFPNAQGLLNDIVEHKNKWNQRTNGPVNAHLI